MSYILSFRRATISGVPEETGHSVPAPPDQSVSQNTLGLVGKRVIDFVGSLLGIVWLSPLLLVVALLIRLDSRGPILFLQKRVGRDGRPFTCMKFRTMVPDAEARLVEVEHLNESNGGVLFKIRRDPRITRLGGALRRSSLDELPQLFNVLAGQMSLVGPRPLQYRDSDLLENVDAFGYARRLVMRPGITGMWQVDGRSETSIDHMIKRDIQYVENWSLWLDIKILIKTVEVVLTRHGAC